MAKNRKLSASLKLLRSNRFFIFMTYSLYLKCVYITLHQIGRNYTDTIASTLLVKVAREIINVFARLHHTYVKKQSTQQK